MKNAGVIAKEVYEKHRNGDSIGDIELSIAAMYFDDVSRLLMPLGPVFRLAATEAMRTATALGDFVRERQK